MEYSTYMDRYFIYIEMDSFLNSLRYKDHLLLDKLVFKYLLN